MKKNRLTIPGLLALLVWVAGCSNDEPATSDNVPVAAQVNATIDGTLTRASDTQWAGEDCIGITSTGGGTEYVNVPYSYKERDAKFQPDGAGIYFQSIDLVTFDAYYPFTGTQGAAAGIINVSTDADYQAADKQSNIDFLFAEGATGSQDSPTINFTEAAAFKHCMSQITLTFKEGSDIDFESESLQSYSLKLICLDGTFDTATGQTKIDESQGKNTLTISLDNVTVNSDGSVVASVILLPQDVQGKIDMEVVVSGNTYYAILVLPDSKQTLDSGYNYTWPVTVSKTAVSVGTAEITKWEEVKGDNVNATM